MPENALYRYVAYGLNICSEIECPELQPGEGTPDVQIRLGCVPPDLQPPQINSLDSPVCQIAAGQCLINLAGTARYLTTGGSEIIVDYAPSVSLDVIRLFLFSTPFGALLHQRGVLPLHASSIATSSGAVAFTGLSGCGKSTLAGAFYRRGFRVLADDICAIETRGMPAVLPASPYLMLWKDSVQAIGLSPDEFRPVRPTLEKLRVPVTRPFSRSPVPLNAIYVIETEYSSSNRVSLSPLHGFHKVDAITRNTFRRTVMERLGLSKRHFLQAVAVAAATRVIRVSRPASLGAIGELLDTLSRDFTP